jgi:3-oxoacyl-[acyl-carrier protein] reductase
MSKKIIITGASTGIGAATAKALAADNTLFLHYNRSAEAVERVAETVKEKKGHPHIIQANLMTEAGCRSLFEAISAKTESLDVLINNAGGAIRRQRVCDLEWSLMEETFALNTFSTMMMTRLCIPLLWKGESPCIVNISSIAARNGGPAASIYGASKGAVDTFTRGAAHELAPDIRVNAIAPGVILTPFHEKVSSEERMKRYKESIPLNRFGEADQIAQTAVFLIENTFITGETVDVNGGHFMR